MSHYFENKVIIVTGGGSGIGKATSLAFAERGARVAIADVNEKASLITVSDIQNKRAEAIFVKTNVADEGDVQNMIHTVVNTFGQLNFAFNSAGIGGSFDLIQDYSTADWQKVFAINVTGMFLCMKHEIAAILKTGGGAIVNCASLLSQVAYSGDSAYVASKHAVVGLTRTAGIEYASKGIRINAVSPGFTETPMTGGYEPTKKKMIEEMHATKRFARPEEIAAAVLWLCSPEASFVIGHNLLIDGGYTII
jgi:NAD(P)-dependent dehydrogenase (short-subunit alcohol dehydrogenase family)